MKPAREQLNRFLQTHRVFNTDELERSCSVAGHHSRNLLAKLSRERRIKKIRNRLYSALPNEAPDAFVPPALLVAAKSTDDAVLGYQSALAFYGMSRNLNTTHTFLTRHRLKPYEVNDVRFRPCQTSEKMAAMNNFGIVEAEVWDTPLRVVSKERLLVDLLDRLDLSGGWEEITNAFQYEDALDYDQLLTYLRLLDHPATAARLGFFLTRFQDTMGVPEAVLGQIESLKPTAAEHFFRNNRQGKLDKRWNLYIPEALAQNQEGAQDEF